MKRLRCFILLFFLAVSILLAYVAWRTYAGLAGEEQAQLGYFSETLLDEMETYLADLIRQEENRSVEAYHHILEPDGLSPRPSPLAALPSQAFILGYLQNNPDGTFQTPLVADLQHVPADRRLLIDQLTEINRVFNRKRFNLPTLAPAAVAAAVPGALEAKQSRTGLAERYLARAPETASKAYLGQKETRTEEITARQALNLASEDAHNRLVAQKTEPSQDRRDTWADGSGSDDESTAQGKSTPAPSKAGDTDAANAVDYVTGERFQVELAPFQSVFISRQYVFFFRRVAIANQIYRQGFVIQVPALLEELATSRFKNQPLAAFMSLRLNVLDLGQLDGPAAMVHSGIVVDAPRFSLQRRFPAPFDFLQASLHAEAIPRSPARRPLNTALAMLAGVMLLGLLAIDHSVRTVVEMSERRSQFVSSVTHELKTPLTNIRMYTEMLEQGIAATPEREQAYLQILDAESARLSRLINNVLELAKLEKKQRRFLYQEGDLTDVFAEVDLIMSPKLKQEKFTLSIAADRVPVFAYDREVLIQLLVNLMENSIKFGRQSARRQITISAGQDNGTMRIAVSDTGPGIPRAALKKIFNDFYRVDSELTRAAGGTGIGLALVKKFVTAMGGRVQAANNDGPGCTISMYLPIRPKAMS